MIPYELFLTVILPLSLFFATIGVDGSRESCPTAAIVKLTEETANSSGYRNESGDFFPPEAMWTENGGKFGCLCDFKTCVQLCCPVGKAIITAEFAYNLNPKCNKFDQRDRRTYTFVTSRRSYEQYNGSISVITHNPNCYPIMIDDWEEKDYVFRVTIKSMNARIKFENKVGFENYMVVRFTETGMYVSHGPIDSDIDGAGWFPVIWNIPMLFILPTFIIYSVITELKNLQGLIFRCYLASYIALMLTVTITYYIILFKASKSRPVIVTSGLAGVFGIYYFDVASMLWLNVMSFDIWRTFRRFCSNRDVNIEERQKTKFIRYCIYSWGGAAVLTTFFMGWSISVRSSELALELLLRWIAVPAVSIAICNTFFYVSTAITIRRRKKETEHLVGGVNKHCKENEQWFNSYLRLFIIVGGHAIPCVVGWYWDHKIFHHFLYVLEVLQSIAIFLVFVWKDEVKHLCRKRFGELLGALCSFFRRHPTRDSFVV